MSADQGRNLNLRVARHRRLLAAACLFGAEAVHVSVIDQHLREWLPAGLFFLSLAVVEGMLGVALLAAPSSRAVRWAIWVSALAVAGWLVSRTLGLSFGPMHGMPTPVGRSDLVATLLEVMTVAVLLLRTSRAPAVLGLLSRRSSTALAIGTVVALTGLAVLPAAGPAHPPPDLYPTCPMKIGPACPPGR